MAEVPGFVFFGSSNLRGATASLAEANASFPTDFGRWFGRALGSVFPITAAAPGVRMWTPRLPYALSISRAIVTGGAGTTLTHGGPASGAPVDSWCFIATNTTGQGKHRRISAPEVGNVVTVAAAWGAPAVANDGTILFFQDSHSTVVNGLTATTIVNGVAVTTIERTSNTPIFTAADVGRTVVFQFTEASYAGGGLTGRATRRVASQTDYTITLDDTLDAATVTALRLGGAGFQVLAGVGAGNSLANYAVGAAFRDLTVHANTAPCYLTGFDYHNYDLQPETAPINFAINGVINSIPELTWQLRSRFNQPLHCVTIGINGSYISPRYVGDLFRSITYGWLHDATDHGWNPTASNSFLTALTTAVQSMETLATAEGNTIKWEGVFLLIAENDTLEPNKLLQIGANIISLRDHMWGKLFHDKRVPLVLAGPSSPTYPNRDVVYAMLNQIAADNVACGVVETRPEIKPLYTFTADGIHWTTASQIQFGKDQFAVWDVLRMRANSASRLLGELPTLSLLRTKVRRRYERSATGSDATATQIDMFINDSIREIHNTLGDTAWFLRRAEEFTLSPSFPGTIDLPRVCKRILRIERASNPGEALTYKGISYTDAGRVQIALHNYGGGPFIVHYLAQWTDLVNETDATLVPIDHVELIVMLTCKRLTECAGNASMAAYYAVESDRLWRALKKENLRYDRMRQGQMEAIGAMDSWRNGPFLGGDEWGL